MLSYRVESRYTGTIPVITTMELVSTPHQLHSLQYRSNGTFCDIFSLNKDDVSAITDYNNWQIDTGKLVTFALFFNLRPIVVLCNERESEVRIVTRRLVERGIETLWVKSPRLTVEEDGKEAVKQQREAILKLFPELYSDTEHMNWLISDEQDNDDGSNEPVPTEPVPKDTNEGINVVPVRGFDDYFYIEEGRCKDFLVHNEGDELVAIAVKAETGHRLLTEEEKASARELFLFVKDDDVSEEVLDLFGITPEPAPHIDTFVADQDRANTIGITRVSGRRFRGFYHVQSGPCEGFLIREEGERLVAVAIKADLGHRLLTEEEKDRARQQTMLVDDNVSDDVKELFGIAE